MVRVTNEVLASSVGRRHERWMKPPTLWVAPDFLLIRKKASTHLAHRMVMGIGGKLHGREMARAKWVDGLVVYLANEKVADVLQRLKRLQRGKTGGLFDENSPLPRLPPGAPWLDALPTLSQSRHNDRLRSH